MLCDYDLWKLDNPPYLKGQPYVECDGCDAAWSEDEPPALTTKRKTPNE